MSSSFSTQSTQYQALAKLLRIKAGRLGNVMPFFIDPNCSSYPWDPADENRPIEIGFMNNRFGLFPGDGPYSDSTYNSGMGAYAPTLLQDWES